MALSSMATLEEEVENVAETYSIRTFNVTPVGSRSSLFPFLSSLPCPQTSGQSCPIREICQFHFLVWPDHGVPQNATALLSFRTRVTPPLQRANARPLQVCGECDVVVDVYTQSHIVVFVCTTQLLKQGIVCLLSHLKFVKCSYPLLQKIVMRPTYWHMVCGTGQPALFENGCGHVFIIVLQICASPQMCVTMVKTACK